MALRSSPAIHTLNNDVLLHIFAFNADMFADNKALYGTCFTAQVCSQWRSLMFDTPSLWGKLIDMDEIYCARTLDWGHDLIRRSGAAPLWIKADSLQILRQRYKPPVAEKSETFARFFSSVLAGNWSRIQKLVIHADLSILGLTRSMLCVPAPQLERFEAPLKDETAPVELQDKDTVNTPLFAWNAPMLRRFYAWGHVVDHHAPWLRHLHFINLDKTYSVLDALTVLAATYDLQDLEIRDITIGDISTPFPSVTLLHLNSLQYCGRMLQCASLLHHLHIPLGCSLAIQIPRLPHHLRMTEKTEHFVSLVNEFASHSARFLDAHIFNILVLKYNGNHSIDIYLRGETTTTTKCSFDLTVPLVHDFSSYQLTTLLNKLTQLDLTRITTLYLYTSDPFEEPCFASFFSCLASLDTIYAESRTLEHLTALENSMAAENEPRIIFPLLKVVVLQVTGFAYSIIYPAEQVRVAAKYISARARNGYSIEVLDISKYAPLDYPPDREVLGQEVNGVKVLYRCSKVDGPFERICGSGNPDKQIDTI
ncbi:hypothetical protein HYPSUDRAFT_38459 [Hypholoma sublateritium FD-334 SS-4]|uniref:Uncharacterized protein n=1 Tax=Hypholoma sublateritium (strain FD-334 SS-4) TaxID=945553 RepID=A0A0D2MLR0_HYPSF|nr:hypothetical protein HYPSUDRAFT_38459 [Hypholoma sublateritium FD-334 SS-4]